MHTPTHTCTHIQFYICIYAFIHLPDAFIQSNLYCSEVLEVKILADHAVPGNQTHDNGVASTMIYFRAFVSIER